MSILADRSTPLPAYEIARRQLYGHVLGGAACVLLAVVAPKDLGWDMLRLGLASVFFLGLATIIWGAAEPLETYLRARIDLCLEDFGAESRALGHAAIDALSRYLTRLVWLIMAVLGLLFLRVLAAWPIGAPLEPAMLIVHWVFWLTLAALPVQMFLSTNRLTEAFSLWRSFQQQVARSRFKPRTVAAAKERAGDLDGPAVTVLGPYRFRAGGSDWSWDDFHKNAIVFGQTGSGKTVTVLNAFLDGLLSSADGSSGTESAAALILDPKGDYRNKIDTLCRRLGRASDLLILDPNRPASSIRWNPFDGPDDALEISDRFAGVLQLLGMKNTQDTFWIDTAKTFLRHAVGLLRATESPDFPPSFAGISDLATRPLLLEARLFVLHVKSLVEATHAAPLDAAYLAKKEAEGNQATVRGLLAGLEEQPDKPQSADAIQTYFRRWEAKPPAERTMIAKEAIILGTHLADARIPHLTTGSEALLAAEYLTNTWLGMPERTRGSVQTQLTTMIDPFLTEPYRTIFSGRSTASLGEILDRGGILYVYMPREDRSAMSRVVNTLIKVEFIDKSFSVLTRSDPVCFSATSFRASSPPTKGEGTVPSLRGRVKVFTQTSSRLKI